MAKAAGNSYPHPPTATAPVVDSTIEVHVRHREGGQALGATAATAPKRFHDVPLRGCEDLVGVDQFGNLVLADDRGDRRRVDTVRCPGRTEAPDLHAAPGSLLGEPPICRDRYRTGRLGACQVETVVDRMVHLDSDPRSALDEVTAALERDDLGETRHFVEVRLRTGNLVPVDLLPDGVRVLGEQNVRCVQMEPRRQESTGFIGLRFRQEPLDDDARVDRQLHRSRSSRSKATLSVCGVPAVRAAISRVRSRN